MNGQIKTVTLIYLDIKKFLKTLLVCDNMSNNENAINKNAFEDFIKTNLCNPQFKNKFVAFVNGEFQDVEDKQNILIKKMYNKFGNVDMYVGKITDKKEIALIDTPEFI